MTCLSCGALIPSNGRGRPRRYCDNGGACKRAAGKSQQVTSDPSSLQDPHSQVGSPSPDPAQVRWLTVEEFAAIFRCSSKAVYGEIRAGKLRVRRIGRILRIPASEALGAEVMRPPERVGGRS